MPFFLLSPFCVSSLVNSLVRNELIVVQFDVFSVDRHFSAEVAKWLKRPFYFETTLAIFCCHQNVISNAYYLSDTNIALIINGQRWKIHSIFRCIFVRLFFSIWIKRWLHQKSDLSCICYGFVCAFFFFFLVIWAVFICHHFNFLEFFECVFICAFS